MNFRILGSGLASVVCSYELTMRGGHVEHIVPNLEKPANHFSGVKIHGFEFDIGMVLLEPRIDVVKRELAEFTGKTDASINQFNWMVFKWLSELGISLEEVSIRSHFRENLIPDFLIADSLEITEKISDREKTRFKRELHDAIKNQAYHPRNKTSSQIWDIPIKKLFRELYGEYFSEFLLQIARRAAGENAHLLQASRHRALWLPLYYPETLEAALNGVRDVIPELPFFIPTGGGVHTIVKRLLNEMKLTQRYSLISEENFNKQNPTSCEDINTCSTSVQVIRFLRKDVSNFAYSSELSRVGIVFGWVSYDIEPKVVHSLDEDSSWFRASISTSFPGSIVIELGHLAEFETESSLMLRANECYRALRLESVNIVGVQTPLISFPVVKSRNELNQSNLGISGETRISTVNSYATDGATTFNEQVLLGLKAASEIHID